MRRPYPLQGPPRPLARCFARLISNAKHFCRDRAGEPPAPRDRALRAPAAAGGRTDLSPTLTAALSTIERFGPLTPTELAARERVQRPTVTRVACRLEEQGLVSRAPDPADGRSALISVTPAGRDVLEAIRTRKDAFLTARLAASAPEDRATLERAAALLEGMLE
jgi:DNA-binding MarR family transcriptional regulator